MVALRNFGYEIYSLVKYDSAKIVSVCNAVSFIEMESFKFCQRCLAVSSVRTAAFAVLKIPVLKLIPS